MNYSELSKTLRCATYIIATFTFMVIVLAVIVVKQSQTIDGLKAETLRLEVKLIDRNVTIDELRNQQAKETVYTAEDIPQLPGNGFLMPSKEGGK
jgi:hypothetical protein